MCEGANFVEVFFLNLVLSLHHILIAPFLFCSHLSPFQNRGRTLTWSCLSISSHLEIIIVFIVALCDLLREN